MSFWKRTMDYLGLGPDEAYDDEYEEFDDDPRQRRGETAVRQTAVEQVPEPADRTSGGRRVFPSRDFDTAPTRRPAPTADDSGVMVRSQRTARPTAEPQTVRPRRFDQATEVADTFKAGQPVILNLDGCEREVARRLIDFASGLCYALDGRMEKVANGVYLLKPTGGLAPDEN